LRPTSVSSAIGANFLAGLPPAATQRIIAEAVLVDVPAGGIVYRDEDAPRSGIVVAGLVRVYLSSAVRALPRRPGSGLRRRWAAAQCLATA
jgi:hypothetical protein